MKCFNPLSVFQHYRGGPIVFSSPPGHSSDYRKLTIRCGSCIGCRMNHSIEWAARMTFEAQLHDQNCFLTLTYSDENLPYAGQLVREHVQLFLKNLRIKLQRKYGKKIRTYYVGEYGDKTNRPHYHILVFGHDFSSDRKLLKKSKKGHPLYTSPLLDETWPYGHANIGEFSFESAAYCARYCLKKQAGKKNPEVKEVYCDIETGEVVMQVPEFGQPSNRPGIVHDWYIKYGADLRRTDHIVVRGKKLQVPRYFDKLTEKYYPEEFEDIKKRRLTDTYEHLTLDEVTELWQAGHARSLLQTASHLRGTI